MIHYHIKLHQNPTLTFQFIGNFSQSWSSSSNTTKT